MSEGPIFELLEVISSSVRDPFDGRLGRVGSLVEAAHLLNDNAGVLR